MDGTPDHTTTLARVSKDWTKFDFTTVTPLESDSRGNPVAFGPNKRICGTLDHPFNDDGSSLVLGLGLSSNSCTTMCSGKETEEESSIDLNLSINLNAGDKRLSDSKKSPIGSSNATNKRKPVLDLDLSLSTGTAESDATTITKGLIIPHKNHSDSQVLARTAPQLVDDGSTSSRWKIGHIVVPSFPNPMGPIISSNAFSRPSSLETASHAVNDEPKRKTRVKICHHEGCTRGARGASALCIGHGGGRRCQRHGCQKGAEGRTVFCKAHGGGRRCQHLGCTKSAEGRTDFCIGHGGGRRCSAAEGCIRAARGKSGLCIRHGGGKRCRVEGCMRSAEGASGLCISHGGGRRCLHPGGCTKGAQGSTSLCKAHGGGRRCTFPGGCNKGAEGSTPFCKGHGGGKRCSSEGCGRSVHGGTLFCVGHGGGKRCSEPGCTKSARGRTSHCVRHGGGRRCASEGCGKSAQGSTAYCKAHGGGRRCSWEMCGKFARGKSGLCAAHGSQVQGKEVGSTSRAGNSVSKGQGGEFISMPFIAKEINMACGDGCWENYSLPEGRVHGGGLMAMLRGGVAFGTSGSSAPEGNGS